MSGKLDKIIEIIGIELAAKLCHDFAGKQIRIKKLESKIGTFQAVIDSIGINAANLLQKEITGLVYIPNLTAELGKQRRQEIIENYRGERIEDYALIVGLTSRRVYQLFKETGVKLPDKPLRKKLIIDDYKGETAREYADKHGINIRSARARLKSNGIIPCSGLRQVK